MAPATARGIETLQLMKTRLTILKFLIILCSVFATTAVFGQVIHVWTNSASVDIGLGANYDPNGQPNGNDGSGFQQTAEWDNRVLGNLTLRYITGWPNTGFGTIGVNIVLTANQTNDVQITAPTTGNSPAAGILNITNDSPTAALHLGDSTANQLSWATRPGTAGTVHSFVNNSAKPAVMDSSVTWVFGGGVTCVMDFGGTGDWIINHNLRANNTPGPYVVVWEGNGTFTWSSGGLFVSALGPITNNGNGTIILKSAGLAQNFTGVAVGNNAIILNNASLLKYDAAASDTIPRLISGTGNLQVNNGTLTLSSGASTFSGNITLSGGELIAGGTENVGVSGPLGFGGTISFTGGTLGWNVANIFDYSPRFSTAASQAYKFDTAGVNVTLATGLSSSGGTLTKANSGTLTLTGTSSYSGLTTVSGGKLVFQGSKTGAGNITLADGAAVGVTTTGTQVTPGTLTLGTSVGATLEFNNVNSTATALLAASTLTSAGTTTININSGIFTIGTSYPLFSWTSGSAPAVSLGSVGGAVGNLSTNGNTIQFNVTSVAITWTGTNSGNWTAANNWRLGGTPTTYADPSPVVFDDTALGETNVIVDALVQPANITVNNNSLIYSITSSSGNDIAGSAKFAKSGNGLLTLSGGANTYTGVSTLSGGTLSVGVLANGGAASDIGQASSSAANLVLNGGTLQYTGGAADVDRLFSLTTAGGAIDASGSGGALNLNNGGSVALSGLGARTLTLTGTSADDNTLAAKLADNGAATSLTKSGPGKWVLTNNNTYSGGTTITAGTLQIGKGDTNGSPGSGNITDNGSLIFNRSGSLTLGTVTGTGSVTLDGSGTLVLPGNNTYQGGTTINAGTLQIGNGGATGTMDVNDPVIDNGTFIVNSTGNLTLSGAITGTGQLIKRGSGVLKLLGNSTYSGPTTIDAGATLQIWQNNTGANATSWVTNNGTLLMMRQDNNVAILAAPISGTGKVRVEVSNGNGGDSTLTGSNTYTGGTYIIGGGLILGDGATPGSGSIVGDVFLTNDVIHATFGPFIPAILTFNRADDFTFTNKIVGEGELRHVGLGTLTLTGANTYTNTTTITGGTLQVGNGGTSGTLGTVGPVTDNGVLVFNRSDNVTFNRVISGGGSLVKEGAGTLTIITNSYSGTTTVSNGTLVINGDNVAASTYVAFGTLGGTGTLYGPVTLDPGTTLAPGASVGTLTINSDLSIGGNLAIEVDKSLPSSNDLVVVSGALTNTGTGTLTVANLGPALAVGDKFTLFSQPVLNGAALTVSGGGATWTNNLVDDGSISVIGFVPAPTLNFTKIGNSLQFTWTGSFKLQSQTNSLSVGIRSNWGDYPGGGTSPITVPIDATQATVFFRLAPTP
jgi:autotransporter-associated beta strand protein